jgi:hypothetical protein
MIAFVSVEGDELEVAYSDESILSPTSKVAAVATTWRQSGLA